MEDGRALVAREPERAPPQKRLPVLPISRTSPRGMEEDPPALQRVSMDGPWLRAQRRRLATAPEAGAGGGRLSTGGCRGRGASGTRNL